MNYLYRFFLFLIFISLSYSSVNAKDLIETREKWLTNSIKRVVKIYNDGSKEKEQLYIVSNTGSLTKLPKGKTKREKLLVSKDNKMSGYIQTNNLNLRREKDFNQALDYFNAL